MQERHKTGLKGWHVLVMLLIFFGAMITANIVMGFYAVRSFTGEDVPKSYRQGLNYNQTLSERQSQSRLNWTVRANSFKTTQGQTRIVVKLQDAQNKDINGLEFSGQLRHPTDKAYDQIIRLQSVGQGRYITDVNLSAGEWSLRAETQTRSGEPFRFSYDLWVR